MNKMWLAIVLPLALSACSGLTSRPNATFDRINKELGDAAANKSKNGSPADADVVGKAMLPPLQLDPPAPPVAEPRFNLAVNNAPASQVFMALVNGTKYSMVFSPEISGNITLNLKNVTVREALETIRELYGYEYKFQGNRILIQANTVQTRIFQINYLASRRHGTSDIRVSSSSLRVGNTTSGTAGATGTSAAGTIGAPNQPNTGTGGSNALIGTDSASIQTISENDFWKDLKTALDMIVGQQEGRVIINPVSGVVLIKALPAELRTVENYLKATQLVVERQVMLEAKIIDVQLNDQYQTGINWASFDKFGGHRWSRGANVQNFVFPGGKPVETLTSSSRTYTANSVSPSGVTSTVNITEPITLAPTLGAAATSILSAFPFGNKAVGFAFQTGSFAALINFLETQGSVYVMSNPRIATLNNQKAVLKVGTDEYFVTNVSTTTTTSTTGSQVSPTITTRPFFSGISLDVTPQIDDDGNIMLHIHPVITEVSEKAKQLDLGSMGGTITLPLASSKTSETDSIVRVQDGNIVAIGGLMSQGQNKNRSGLPGVSGLPGIGALFGTTDDSANKRELVILLKPTIIQDENSWKQDLLDTQDRLQTLDRRKLQSVQ